MSGLYSVLGVEPDATPDQIKKAYRKLAKAHHPDATGGTEDETFKRISFAYSILSDPVKRSFYDETGDEGGAAEWERHVFAVLSHLFVEAVMEGTSDLVARVNTAIKHGLDESKKSMASAAAKIRKLEKGRDRLFLKDKKQQFKDDPVYRAIQETIDSHERKAAEAKTQVKLAETMMEHVARYGCTPLPPSEVKMTFQYPSATSMFSKMMFGDEE